MSIGKGEAFDVERKDFRTRIAELEAENAQLKVGIEQSRSDALSNLERLISVEAENAKLRALVERGADLYDTDIQRAKTKGSSQIAGRL